MKLYIGILLLIVTFFSGCTCKVKTITQVENSLTKNEINKVTKVEYIEISPSYAPKNHVTRTITITKSLITEKEYSDYGNVLESEGRLVVDSKNLDMLKHSIIDNNISSCKTSRVDCYGKEISEEIATGCESRVLNIYTENKKIFSEFISCNLGKLCGDYTKVINDIKELSSSIKMKKVNNKLIKFESPIEPRIIPKKHNKEAKKITLFFESDKYSLDEKSIKKLEKFIDSLKKQNYMSIKIMGNTDRFGSQEYNYHKGLKRAKFVKKFFIDKGFKEENIVSLSYGESNPVCVEVTQECHAKNRRVDIVEIY